MKSFEILTCNKWSEILPCWLKFSRLVKNEYDRTGRYVNAEKTSGLKWYGAEKNVPFWLTKRLGVWWDEWKRVREKSSKKCDQTFEMRAANIVTRLMMQKKTFRALLHYRSSRRKSNSVPTFLLACASFSFLSVGFTNKIPYDVLYIGLDEWRRQ